MITDQGMARYHTLDVRASDSSALLLDEAMHGSHFSTTSA